MKNPTVQDFKKLSKKQNEILDVLISDCNAQIHHDRFAQCAFLIKDNKYKRINIKTFLGLLKSQWLVKCGINGTFITCYRSNV
jgi:hypothetical protein